jgi:hypothetical protein
MIGAFRLPRLFQNRLVDLKLGFALLRDRRVPLRTKLFALLIGYAITGVVEVLEIPVEGVLAALAPILGLAGDVVTDGAEAIIGPVVIGAALLPRLAPRDIVETIRSERARKARGEPPIIDV